MISEQWSANSGQERQGLRDLGLRDWGFAMRDGGVRRDRKASVPGQRSRKRAAVGKARERELELRLKRKAGRLEELEPKAIVKLMSERALKGDCPVIRLMVKTAENVPAAERHWRPAKPKEKERPKRWLSPESRRFLLGLD